MRRWLGPADGGAVYAPPGYLLFTRDGRLLAQAFDRSAMRLSGEPVQVAPQTVASSTRVPPSFSASTTGVLIYHVGRPFRNQLAWFSRSGREIERPLDAGSYFGPALSPDGQHVAVYLADPQIAVWHFDLTRRLFSRRTSEPAVTTGAVWSPDAHDVVFAANEQSTYGIYTMRLHGGSPQRVLSAAKAVVPTDWSTDRRIVIYQTREPDTGSDVWVLPLAGDAPPRPFARSRFNERDARLSPNGRWMAYASDETGAFEVYVQSFMSPGIKWQISSGGGWGPVWRRDGSEIFYLSRDGRLMAVAVESGTRFQAAAPTALFRVPGEIADESAASYAITADAQRFLLNLAAPDRAKLPPFRAEVVVNWLSELKRRGGNP